jgi:hypothetical protein
VIAFLGCALKKAFFKQSLENLILDLFLFLSAIVYFVAAFAPKARKQFFLSFGLLACVRFQGTFDSL